MDSDNQADAIAEELLHLTGFALWSRDFDAFKIHFKLPFRLVYLITGNTQLVSDLFVWTTVWLLLLPSTYD